MTILQLITVVAIAATTQPHPSEVADWMKQGLVSLATALGALGAIWAFVWSVYVKAIKPAKGFFFRLNNMLRDHPNLKHDIAEIKNEVTHNGGASLKDSQKRTEEMVGKITAVQQAQIRADQDPAFYCDVRGEVISITAGYTRLTGLELAAAINEGWKLAIHPDDLDKVLTRWHESIRTKTVFIAEYRYINVHFKSVTACRVVAEPIFVQGLLHGWSGRIEEVVKADMGPDDDAMRMIDEVLDRKANATPPRSRDE